MPPPPDSLRVSLEAPPSVAAGEQVPIVVRLANLSDRSLELHLVGREIAFDIIVARLDGTVVWRRLAHAPVQGILQMKTLDAHEQLEFRALWLQQSDAGARVAPGEYTLRGSIPTEHPQRPLQTETRRLAIRTAP